MVLVEFGTTHCFDQFITVFFIHIRDLVQDKVIIGGKKGKFDLGKKNHPYAQERVL